MFIKPSNPIYWLTAILLILISFQKFNLQKNNKPQIPKPEPAEMEFDVGEKSLINTINEISEILKFIDSQFKSDDVISRFYTFTVDLNKKMNN